MADFVEAYPGNEEPLIGVTTDLRCNVSVNGVLTAPSSFVASVTSLRTGASVTVGATSTSSTVGELILAMPASSLTQADVFTATWNVTTASGGHEFIFDYDVRPNPIYTLAELREFGVKKMTDGKFPDEQIVRVRKLVTEMFEEYCNVAFVPRYEEFIMDGPDAGGFRQFLLFVPTTRITAVPKVVINGTALTATELADLEITQGGAVYNPSGWTMDIQSITIGVVHGWGSAPREIRRAALSYTQHLITPGKITERAIILTDETGTWRLQQSRVPDRPTGFPDIDFALTQHRELVV